MASFHLLFLALAVVSVCGYDLNTRQQYLPLQTYPSQNGYAIVYTTTSQLPARTYALPTYPTPTHMYPANYVIPRQAYYTPYPYQPKDTTSKVTYPVRGYAVRKGDGVPSVYEGQIYSPSYSYQATEASQQRTYPVVYTINQQENTSPMQENQGQIYSPSYPYQTRASSSKVLFPFRGYTAEQQNTRTRQEQEYLYQTKEELPKVTLPVGGYLIQQDNIPLHQERTYPYHTKEAIQKVTYPVQGYPEGSANTHLYQGTYASRYPEGYYQTVNQGYPMKQEDVSRNLLPNKPVMHIKYASSRGYPNQHITEEVMQQNREDSWVNNKDSEKNAINIDKNLVY